MFLYLYALVILVFQNSECAMFIENDLLDERLQVSLSKGIVQGRKAVTSSGKEYWAFQGIPYAQPPTGVLRFRPPKAAESWSRVLDATKERSGCVQILLRAKNITTIGSEDCLFINIYAPKDPKTTSQPLPVLVWIYGGAFLEGNSSTEIYGPDYLLDNNLIVVSFNYRIGLFGFLSTGDEASYGNYGLKDQNLALRWIQKNIGYFGGDNNQITISGQSAGAASVFYHLVSPKSRGLFQRAIANSGTTLCTFSYQSDAKEIAFQLGLAVGIDTLNSKELVYYLRKTDVNKLNEASKSLSLLHMSMINHHGFPFSPVIEPKHKNAFITESSYTLLERGNFYKVPVLMGMNTKESLLFKNLITTFKPMAIIYDLSPGSLVNPSMNIKSFERKRELGKKIKNHYFKSNSIYQATLEELLEYFNDDQFVRPIRKTAQLASRHTSVYFYLFSYISDFGIKGLDSLKRGTIKGVSHTEELQYIWKRNFPTTRSLDNLIIQRMTTLWSNFIKTGNPTPQPDRLLQNVVWSPVRNIENITYLQIDQHLSMGQNYRKEYMQLWDQIYDEYGVKPYITY